MAETQNTLSAQLADIRSQMDAATKQASAVIEGLSAEQLAQRPEPNSWSVAECLVHLNLTSKEYLPLLDEALQRSRQEPIRVNSKLRMNVTGMLLKWALEPPARFKSKTTAQFQPLDTGPIEGILPTFVSLQEQLKARVESANGLAIDKVKLTSPFNDRIKYNLFSAFQILVTHQRRHIWQAEQVKKAI